MELTIFSCCLRSVSYQQTSVGGWKLISGATGDETVRRRWIGRACSVWNNVVLWWKYCLWALDSHEDVALGSSAKFELDCNILKLHPKGGGLETLVIGQVQMLTSPTGWRYTKACTSPAPLCPGICRNEVGCRRDLHCALMWKRIRSKSDQDLGLCSKVPLPCWTKYCWAELAIPFLITKNY